MKTAMGCGLRQEMSNRSMECLVETILGTALSAWSENGANA
jgi:hypothetical protein